MNHQASTAGQAWGWSVPASREGADFCPETSMASAQRSWHPQLADACPLLPLPLRGLESHTLPRKWKPV